MSGPAALLTSLLLLLAGIAAIVLFIMLLVPATKGVFWLITSFFRAIGAFIAHLSRFVYGMFVDTLRFVGAVITAVIFVPLVLVNVIIGRWSASRHFGLALQDEFRNAGGCLYRVVIGHPARLLLLHSVTEGIEKRVPEAMANAPGPDRPRSKRDQFDGYTIVGSLPGGGSGARLYIADPSKEKAAAFERNGAARIGQVVIKSFSVNDGSSLPQIVRESRSLEAARRLGLVLDHSLTAERFHYVMPYVAGDPLSTVTHRLHGASGPGGLDVTRLRDGVGYVADLVETLERYHRGGLWHKDVKPDNIIVSSEDGRAHLVDLGLVTPLRSAMTLTTHGTEYYRDPEVVRRAQRGAKVHEIDGGKVDLYAAGAVLYTVIEDDLPAHGKLSRITKRCPEALRWIVNRAMADMEHRYASAGEMLTDLRAVLHAADPFLLKPKDLPSMTNNGLGDSTAGFAGYDDAPDPLPRDSRRSPRVEPGPRGGVGVAGGPARAPGARPGIRLVNWWSGAYVVDGEPRGSRSVQRPVPPASDFLVAKGLAPDRGHAHRGTAPQTAQAMRQSAAERVRRRREGARRKRAGYNNNPNLGVAAAALLFLLAIGAIVAWLAPASVREEFRQGFEDGLGDEAGIGLDADHPRAVRSQRPVVRMPVFAFAQPARAAVSDEQSPGLLGTIQERVHSLGQGALDLAGALSGEPITTASGTLIALGDDNADERAIPPSGLRVLMLSDRGRIGGLGEDAAARDIVARLRDAGYTVLGLGTGAEDIEPLAQARRRIGTAGPQDRRAWARLKAWMDEGVDQRSQHAVHAILWVPHEADGPWRLIPSNGLGVRERSVLMQTIVGEEAGDDASGATGA